LVLDAVVERTNSVTDQVLLKQLVAYLLTLRATRMKRFNTPVLNIELHARQVHQLLRLEQQRLSLRECEEPA
jgi:hypothetical protein